MAYKILWVSRHSVKDFQIKWLQNHFDKEIEVVTCPTERSSAKAVKEYFDQSGCDDLIVVAPYSVLDHLCRLGLRPLWSVNPQVNQGEPYSFEFNGRYYRFDGFKRVVKLELVLEDL